MSEIEAEVAAMSRGAVVAAASPKRSGKQRSYLRSLGHALKPVVQIGQHGLTQPLVDAVDGQVETHELIKVKLLESAPCTPEVAAIWLHRAIEVDVVQIVGRTLLIYRQPKRKRQIQLPKTDA